MAVAEADLSTLKRIERLPFSRFHWRLLWMGGLGYTFRRDGWGDDRLHPPRRLIALGTDESADRHSRQLVDDRVPVRGLLRGHAGRSDRPPDRDDVRAGHLLRRHAGRGLCPELAIPLRLAGDRQLRHRR